MGYKLPPDKDIDSVRIGDEFTCDRPPKGYIPPLDETVLIEGEAVDDLKILIFDLGALTLVGLSERDDLSDYAFEMETMGLNEEKMMGWKITRRTKEDFSQRWEVPIDELVIPKNLPKSIGGFPSKSPMQEMFERGGRETGEKKEKK